MLNYQALKKKFVESVDLQAAQGMKKYMRNQFEFYGYRTKPRKDIYHQGLLAAKKTKQIDWQLLNQCWDDQYREMQYFVCDYLIAMKKFLRYEDIIRIENYVRSKQWWDTIDTLVKPISYLGLQDSRVDELMLKWSQDGNFWVRRVAIEYQLLRKDKMNTDLLSQIIKNNLNSKEFFINKAIGWALRDYSKTNPQWVADFIAANKKQLATLSIREGSKYLK
ncbi:DNA alkylation repair protein [Limosilactobacillus sp. STM2_1]|uniref:DNA alkylation repair protein n=1 Tax=Limosilactobacillus rudii TaxID=2759755 RepID=A0A7W3YM05_9LACO|nr:DNA alkylation repair protein [Limosilactobacillus rudii]MBB1078473.1 DNA alkylation repair protein [Limosilactobacillus rudii]MBB1096603.1 DNA alkylation repair protein [Limosilactobacillus rudii]MCD7134201.1 DNA alkylation repair protein [Limosilactobacillus rudii]